MAFWKSSRDEFVNRRRSTTSEQILLVSARVNGAKQAHVQKITALSLLGLALAGAIWVSVIGAGAVGAKLFAQNSRFEIHRFDLHSTGRLTPAHLLAYAGLQEGQNLFAVSMDAVRAKLEKQPLISRAEVQRRLPDTLIVNVEERIALARITPAGSMQLPIDREGHLMSPPAAAHLPVITGIAERGLSPGGVIRDASTVDALKLLDLQDTTHLAEAVPIASVDVSDPTQIMVTLRNGGRASFGRDHLDRRLNRLAEMIRHGDESDQDLVFADLTVDRNEPVTYKPRGDAAPAGNGPAPATPATPRRTRPAHG